MNVRKLTAIALCAALFSTTMEAGVGGKEAVYRGGTVTRFKQDQSGKMTFDDKGIMFASKKTGLHIPYGAVESVEYGQKAGRRIGAAVALTVLISPLGLLALASKKRKHIVTLTWKDEAGTGQAGVFELGKDAYRAALATIEVRTGKQVEFQDEDAKKQMGAAK